MTSKHYDGEKTEQIGNLQEDINYILKQVNCTLSIACATVFELERLKKKMTAVQNKMMMITAIREEHSLEILSFRKPEENTKERN